jgi:hypothetical protein
VFVGEGITEGNWNVGVREIVSVLVGVTVRFDRGMAVVEKKVGDNDCTVCVGIIGEPVEPHPIKAKARITIRNMTNDFWHGCFIISIFLLMAPSY